MQPSSIDIIPESAPLLPNDTSLNYWGTKGGLGEPKTASTFSALTIPVSVFKEAQKTTCIYNFHAAFSARLIVAKKSKGRRSKITENGQK